MSDSNFVLAPQVKFGKSVTLTVSDRIIKLEENLEIDQSNEQSAALFPISFGILRSSHVNVYIKVKAKPIAQS